MGWGRPRRGTWRPYYRRFAPWSGCCLDLRVRELWADLRLRKQLVDVDGLRDLCGPTQVCFSLLDSIGKDRLRVRRNFIGSDEEAASHEERLQCARKLTCRSEALTAILREGFHDDLFEIDRVATNEGRRPWDVALLDLRERVE